MDWLQPVSRGGDCTVFDDCSGIGEVVPIELVPSRQFDDRLGELNRSSGLLLAATLGLLLQNKKNTKMKQKIKLQHMWDYE